MKGFQKFDQGKPDMHLLPVDALVAAAEVMTTGAKKYSAHNWRKATTWNRYYDATIRHLFAWQSGEDNDPESAFHHIDHAVCNLLMLSSLIKTQTGEDDRYKVGSEIDSEIYISKKAIVEHIREAEDDGEYDTAPVRAVFKQAREEERVRGILDAIDLVNATAGYRVVEEPAYCYRSCLSENNRCGPEWCQAEADRVAAEKYTDSDAARDIEAYELADDLGEVLLPNKRPPFPHGWEPSKGDRVAVDGAGPFRIVSEPYRRPTRGGGYDYRVQDYRKGPTFSQLITVGEEAITPWEGA